MGLLESLGQLDDDVVFILHLPLQLDLLAVRPLGRNAQTLRLLVVLHDKRGVRGQSQFRLIGVLVLGQYLLLLGIVLGILFILTILTSITSLTSLTSIIGFTVLAVFLLVWSLFEAFVYFLQEGAVVIERLHVQRAIDGQVAVVLDGVTQRGAIVKCRTTYPRVAGIVVGIGIQPVKDGQFVEGQLVGGLERLLVVEGRAQVLDALLHRVLPRCVAFWIEVFIDRRIGLLNLCMGSRLEVHVERLRQIPAQ